MKVILVGESGVGKTALLQRSCTGTFQEHYKQTIGADFLSKFYTVFDVPCEMNVWDTAGQERWQAATRHFFRGADVAIVCFDVNDVASFEKVPLWLERVEAEQPEGQQPLSFLVGTKSDLFNAVGTARAGEWATAQGLEYFETSAKEGTNVKWLLDRLVTVFMDHHLRTLAQHAKSQAPEAAGRPTRLTTVVINAAPEPSPARVPRKACC
eukprot:EG_transcript_19317